MTITRASIAVLVGLLADIGPLQAQAPSATTENPPFEFLQLRWTNSPDAELKSAAEAGDAAAQYFYWSREIQRTFAEAEALSDRTSSNFYRLSAQDAHRFAEQEKSSNHWDSASENELRKAADSGDYLALNYLARRKQNEADSAAKPLFEWLQRSADQGFAAAEAEFGFEYLRMTISHLEMDQARGLDMLRRAADHGWASAQYELGRMYLKGELMPPDMAKALEYLRQAADQHGPRSQYELAMLYANGYGVPRSEADSPVALLKKSAANSYAPAMHALADRYRTGIGVQVDYILALRWYDQARWMRNNGAAGFDQLTDDVGRFVDQTLQPQPELTRDYVPFARAASVYLKAVRANDTKAMTQIGEWYLGSRYVPRDLVEAFRWFDLAAEHGDTGALAQRDRVKTMLTPEQLQQVIKTNAVSGPRQK